MSFKSYDLVVRYTNCDDVRCEKKWGSIQDFYEDMYTDNEEKLWEIPMDDDYDVEAIFFGHTGDVKHFATIGELVDFCRKQIFAE